MSTIDLICTECNSIFKKEKKEYFRRVKITGTHAKFFCNRSCATSHRNKNKTDEQKKDIGKRLKQYQVTAIKNSQLKLFNREWTPELALFSYYLRKARTRSKRCGWEMDLTYEYLEKLWKRQSGQCAFSGISLTLNKGNGGNKDPFRLASLDRINPKLGYTKNNVQFISSALNYAKKDGDNEEFKQFLLETSKGVLNR